MHNDREVRAREGMVDLRNTKEYKAFHAKSRDHSINQQPRIQPQMSYKAQLGSLNYGYVMLLNDFILVVLPEIYLTAT
jgi:hypothetical protein